MVNDVVAQYNAHFDIIWLMMIVHDSPFQGHLRSPILVPIESSHATSN